MPLEDYAHWNEDAERIWWEEEGKHIEGPDDDYDPDDYLPTQEELNDGPLSDHETVLRAVWDRLSDTRGAFNSMNLHSGRTKDGSVGEGWITVTDPFEDGNAFLDVTIEVKIEGRA